MCEEIDMPWDWPVEINFHEAKAYCNWLGADYRLLTEAEFHAVRDFPVSIDIWVKSQPMWLAQRLEEDFQWFLTGN